MDLRIKDKNVKIQFWDTAGQEKYQSLASGYYRNAHGAFIVYDITRRNSFDKAISWLDKVKMNGESGIKIMLLGNKTDL